jgi:hypothetical protein
MLPQSIRSERGIFRYPQSDLLREVLALGADGVTDDLVAVASSPARTLRISGVTRAATPSKNAQPARSSVIPRSSSASLIGPCSIDEGEKEMPQKSVDPVPIRSSTISRGPAASNSRAIPAISATGR